MADDGPLPNPPPPPQKCPICGKVTGACPGHEDTLPGE